PKRTIRFCLWTGEEQGLFGSEAYVKALTDAERERISACFVDDGGTNYEGGLLCYPSQKDMLEEAIAPVSAAFPELPMEISVRERASLSASMGSDHYSFIQAGIPGFFWKESGSGGREGKDYTFIHHTQNDTLRYVVPEYLVQSATCSAVVAYQLAEADTLLPREAPVESDAPPPPDPTFVLAASELAGDWQLTVQDEDVPDLGLTFTLETAQDGRVRGSVSSMMGTERIREGKWDAAAKSAEFSIVTDFGTLVFRARLEQGRLAGTFSVGGRDIPFRGEPKPREATPIAGRWKGRIAAMDAEFHVQLELGEGGALSGRFKSSRSDSEIYAGKWDAAAQSLSFEYDYPQGGRLPVSAHLVGTKLVGKIGENAEFEAEREGD